MEIAVKAAVAAFDLNKSKEVEKRFSKDNPRKALTIYREEDTNYSSIPGSNKVAKKVMGWLDHDLFTSNELNGNEKFHEVFLGRILQSGLTGCCVTNIVNRLFRNYFYAKATTFINKDALTPSEEVNPKFMGGCEEFFQHVPDVFNQTKANGNFTKIMFMYAHRNKDRVQRVARTFLSCARVKGFAEAAIDLVNKEYPKKCIRKVADFNQVIKGTKLEKFCFVPLRSDYDAPYWDVKLAVERAFFRYAYHRYETRV